MVLEVVSSIISSTTTTTTTTTLICGPPRSSRSDWRPSLYPCLCGQPTILNRKRGCIGVGIDTKTLKFDPPIARCWFCHLLCWLLGRATLHRRLHQPIVHAIFLWSQCSMKNAQQEIDNTTKKRGRSSCSKEKGNLSFPTSNPKMKLKSTIIIILSSFLSGDIILLSSILCREGSASMRWLLVISRDQQRWRSHWWHHGHKRENVNKRKRFDDENVSLSIAGGLYSNRV